MIEAKVTGTKDFTETLKAIPNKLRRRALRNALAAGARLVRDAAKRRAPVLKLSSSMAPYRKPGTVRGAISVRTSKQAKANGDVGVFVNVRPAQGAKYREVKAGKLFGNLKQRGIVKASQRGTDGDPFYWRFVNFKHVSRGGRTIPGVGFLEAGAAQLGAALAVFEKQLGPIVQRLDTNPRDPL